VRKYAAETVIEAEKIVKVGERQIQLADGQIIPIPGFGGARPSVGDYLAFSMNGEALQFVFHGEHFEEKFHPVN
jgi:hypothetical protein